VSAEESFWRWFVRFESELYDFEPDRDGIFDELSAQLQKVHPNLTFEFGPSQPKREFVISAGGIKDAFPAVIGLAKAAPALERWCVTAFRPRRSELSATIELGGKIIALDSVEFSLLDNGTIAGIHLFIPGFRENDAAYGMIGYLLLDECLGEYDVETRVGLIKMSPTDAPVQFRRYGLNRLPELFDQLTAQLSGRIERPS
jgi:hypothetical protein